MSPDYLLALGLTLLIELPVVAALAGTGQRNRALLDGLLLNLFTHPMATLLVRSWGGMYWPVELLVFLTEAAGYRWVTRLSTRRALLTSGAANSLTALAGWLLYREF